MAHPQRVIQSQQNKVGVSQLLLNYLQAKKKKIYVVSDDDDVIWSTLSTLMCAVVVIHTPITGPVTCDTCTTPAIKDAVFS